MLDLDRPDFEPNFDLPRHRWYPFKEGFSASLVASFLLDYGGGRPGTILDPFAGSGTSIVEAAAWGWRAVGVEVNPFTRFLASVKVENEYRPELVWRHWRRVLDDAVEGDVEWRLPRGSTLVGRKGLDKWLFNPAVARRYEQLRSSIERVVPAGKYRRLLTLGLMAGTVRASNAKRDGKCWRYKTGWRLRRYGSADVDAGFCEVMQTYADDVAAMPRLAGVGEVVLGDSRVWLSERGPSVVGGADVVLTSPPYLNSFDYTDIYRPECFLLGVADTAQDLRKVRLQTLRSHVQVEWPEARPSSIARVHHAVRRVRRGKLWDRRLPAMINAYFVDLEDVVTSCEALLRPNGTLGMVVASSAYSGVVIPVPEILGDIMSARGLDVELRELRVTAGNGHHQNRSNKTLVESLVIGRKRRA
ncbi:MAG TPA: hypothetical protein VFQ53_41240 [Kofleriaceae bacterium]|nr:hypothetical protein [Kofleriaceae bacterium]